MSHFQKLHQRSQTVPQDLKPLRPIFRRSIYIIGLMLRFFDFTDKNVYGDAYPVSFYFNIINLNSVMCAYNFHNMYLFIKCFTNLEVLNHIEINCEQNKNLIFFKIVLIFIALIKWTNFNIKLCTNIRIMYELH